MSELSLRQLLDAADKALEAEGVSPDLRRRVMNRLLYGSPYGPDDRIDIEPDPDETAEMMPQSRVAAELEAIVADYERLMRAELAEPSRFSPWESYQRRRKADGPD